MKNKEGVQVSSNYEQLIEKKQEKLDKLYVILNDTKGKIKALETEINTLRVSHDAEQFGRLKKDLGKQYNVDAILSALSAGKLDLSAYALEPQKVPISSGGIKED